MPDNTRLPTIPFETRSLEEVGGNALPPSLQILLDEGLYTRMKQLSGLMAKAEGFTPRHLVGKPEACFAIINTSLDWKLNPHFVARHTYQTPGGSIGFDGALVQSVLERSGRFIGAPKFEYHGDWRKIAGKFEKKLSKSNNEYLAGTWTDGDADGLGIIVRWQVRGEGEPRCWPGEGTPFWVNQCYPRNSPLWATDPKTQIAYLAIRRFANLTSPGILGAASFDYDDMVMAGDLARDVTPPRPRPEDYVTETASVAPAKSTEEGPVSFGVTDFVGEVTEYRTAEEASIALDDLITKARSPKVLEGVWESNLEVVAAIKEAFIEQGRDPSSAESAYVEAKKAFEQGQDHQSPSITASSSGDQAPEDAGSSPAAAGHSAGRSGQAERGVIRSGTPVRPEEQRQPSPPAARKDPSATSTSAAAPQDGSKTVEHAPRDENFWSQKKFLLPGKTAKEVLYYTHNYLRQCRDQFDINGIETDNASRFQEMSANDRKEVERMIGQRRKELPA